MTDYQRYIGGSATLMIRTVGTDKLEFWVKTGPQTYNYQQDWSFEVGGFNSGRRQFRMVRGGDWQLMGYRNTGDIGGEYDVHLVIYNEGLGFPTYDFVQRIQLGRRPAPPNPPVMVEHGVDAVHVVLNWGEDGGTDLGGLPVLESEIWWSYDGVPRTLFNNTRDVWIVGLPGRTRIYVWGKLRNEAGWSDFGARGEAYTLGVPDAPPPPFPVYVAQNMFVAASDYAGYDGGRPIEEWQFSYGKNPDGGALAVNGGPKQELRQLDPGMRYYYWVRVRNAIGWSPWSQRSEQLLIAGSTVTIDNVVHRAVPYIKVDGVWRLARPWSKYVGEWKETGW